ncbi:MAG: hypothetical protein V4582_23080 [Pseudomonadota bacterium]
MNRTRPSQQEAIERYLGSGEFDARHFAWPGDNFMECDQIGTAALREALIATVRQRSAHAVAPRALGALDITAFGRARLAPMVRGLFPPNEQEAVLDVLAGSIVFLTPVNIESVLARTPWLGTAWNLANLYLGSVNMDLLACDAPQILGLSEETTCYVSMTYFEEQDAFDDYVVHEAAHIFHNCKRETIGLPDVRGREWLLDIDFRKRETFAYACETYSRIVACGHDSATRKVLLATYSQGTMPAPSELDRFEYIDILSDAVASRNGWKRILARCAAHKGQR